VRTPLKGESSSAGELSSDAPTLFGAPDAERYKESSQTYGGSRLSQDGPRSYPGTGGQPILEVGSVVAHRYEIVALLGEGGMGAVYKAKDLELNRTIALKTIRHELGGNLAIVERFKQELILSTQVTHRNVVRIFDLGESDGMKFITMEYIEGKDLRTIIYERGKLPPDEVVDIIAQVCRALDAAHSVGVIHRDLKPQNIMRDQNGRILVMDFGLARTLEGDGMTMSGALVGTMEYMSPEQALSKSLDQRSDIYSLGLIFYELLSGESPFRADTALASLIRRTQERAMPLSQCTSNISGPLDQIVARCLEREVELRYQSATEILADLELWQRKGVVSMVTSQAARRQPVLSMWLWEKRWWLWGAAALALVFGIAGYVGVHSKSASPTSKESGAAVQGMSLAILPFRNSSGDANDAWIGASVADMLSTDIGQSAHLRTVSTDRLHQVLSDLRIGPDTVIDPDTVRRVAQFSNADIVVSGQYARFGDQIVIDATIRDIKRGQSVAVKAQALAKDLPTAIDSLADSVRKNLSLSPDVLQELKAQSFKPNSTSVEALRNYNEGLALMREGKNLDAYKSFQVATKDDPQFALALSRLAEVQSELGFESDAEQSSRRATELASSEDLPLPEKYLITANHARIIKDNKQAIEAYKNLAASWPSDVDVQYNLGGLYIATGDYAKARDMFSKILQADPKNIKALWQMGVVEALFFGNPQAALDSLSKGLNLATQVDNQEQKALILLSMGISYKKLNNPEEALRNFEESIAINEKIGQKRGVAAALAEVANLQAQRGNTDVALTDFNKALALLREIGMKKEAGDTLVDIGVVYQDRGEYDQALQRYKEALQIQRETGDQNYEALCLNNIADVYLAKSDTDNAFTYYQQALQLREKLGVSARISETLGGLAEAYTQTGQYDAALTSLMRGLELSRQVGDARQTALLSHQIGLVFEYQGRFGAAVKSMQESTKTFRDRGEHGSDMAILLNDLAGALARAGRGDESSKPLDEAEAIAREVKNDALIAQILNTRGDVAFYRGDIKSADQFYKSALALSTHAKDNDTLVLSKLNVARMAMAQDHPKEALGMLRPLNSSDTANAYLSLQRAIANAQAEVDTRDYAKAERDLEQSLARSEKAGTRLDSARINYLLGTSMRLRGTAEKGRSSYYYGETLRLLDAIRADPGAENVLHRADLKTIYDDARQWKM